MKIVTVRRISQVFFFALFCWFCIVSTVGDDFWRLHRWPVNLFLHSDPLAAVGTLLSTHRFFAPFILALIIIIVTIIFGRFFCGFVCPFGSIHNFFSFLKLRKKPVAQKIQLNKYRKAQGIKYIILAVFLAMAAFPSLAATLQIGLLDPIPLVSRSFNLLLVPILDKPFQITSVTQRYYEVSLTILLVFFAAVAMNFVIPRFYCRFVCPLGALFAILGRFSIWRIGKNTAQCSGCRFCEQNCEGGCEPGLKIKISECALCFNCRQACKKRDDCIRYQTRPSLAGEVTGPDVSRRGFVLSIVSGFLAVPAIRLSAKVATNWYYKVIRPPGSLAEPEFLKRCIKCGQCIRICPTNVLQPAGMEGGFEGLWTPILNNRIGTSGCQLNCVSCSQICPTAAIRPITLDEKIGRGGFAGKGPIRLGTAFIDRGRCLPWAFDKPCIVCEENCPVSPKAIYTSEYFSTVRNRVLNVRRVVGNTIETIEADLVLDKYATGDYYCFFEGDKRAGIIANSQNSITVEKGEKFDAILSEGSKIEIKVRLQRPFIDLERCIGCGVCEHECPVSGERAVRVSAEGESRSKDRKMLLG